MHVTDYSIRTIDLPLERSIGDSQIDPVESVSVAYLQLETSAGERGVGFDAVGGSTAQSDLQDRFASVGNRLLGESPFAVKNRIERPRGGNHGIGEFDRLVDIALWDVCGRHLDAPVYELMGGEDPEVPAYASGLAFHHDDENTREIYERFRELGFRSAKVKVGYPTVEEDIERLRLVRDVMGDGGDLLIDANEAFTPKEAIRRVHAYQEAGFDIYWFEDPVFREDLDGIRRVAEALPSVYVNVGEYVDFEGKRRLLEEGCADVLNVHGLTDGRAAARLASAYAKPVAFGNTPADIGVHAAAALPEVDRLECSLLGWSQVLETPVTFVDGRAVAPDRPGHGLAFSDEAFETYGHSTE